MSFPRSSADRPDPAAPQRQIFTAEECRFRRHLLNAAVRHADLRGTPFQLLFVALQYRACWASNAKLAEKVGLDPRKSLETIRRALNRLVQSGFLIREPRGDYRSGRVFLWPESIPDIMNSPPSPPRGRPLNGEVLTPQRRGFDPSPPRGRPLGGEGQVVEVRVKYGSELKAQSPANALGEAGGPVQTSGPGPGAPILPTLKADPLPLEAWTAAEVVSEPEAPEPFEALPDMPGPSAPALPPGEVRVSPAGPEPMPSYLGSRKVPGVPREALAPADPVDPPIAATEAPAGRPAAPKEFDNLCARAARILGPRGAVFSDRLRAAWGQDRRIACWWEDAENYPRGSWTGAIDALARPGIPPDKLNLNYYLGIVRRMASEDRRGVAQASPARPEPKPESRPAYLSLAAPREPEREGIEFTDEELLRYAGKTGLYLVRQRRAQKEAQDAV